jgi:SAM-dependent methyltransferase
MRAGQCGVRFCSGTVPFRPGSKAAGSTPCDVFARWWIMALRVQRVARRMMQSETLRTHRERADLATNRGFYDPLWSDATFVGPERFNTWPLVQSLSTCGRRLEVGPGLRPRLPIPDTQFVDISMPALAKLRGLGAQVVLSQVTSLPFPDAAFDLVCALDIIEHVDDDDGALSELARVAKTGAAVLISTPLYASLWTSFDDFVGHRRRYEPPQLLSKLTQHHLRVERSAVFGMQPRSPRLVNLGMWWLLHHRERAMWWYNRVFVQLALRFQKRLRFAPGMTITDGADEILLVCRRES